MGSALEWRAAAGDPAAAGTCGGNRGRIPEVRGGRLGPDGIVL
jgi:hypothetical protein